MKYFIIILSFSILGVGFILKNESIDKSAFLQEVQTKGQIFSRAESLGKNSTQSELSSNDPGKNVADYEKEFKDKNSSELKETINQLEKNVQIKLLIKSANENRLSDKQKSVLTSHIRMEQALNKILLDRKLKKLEESYL